MPRVRHLPSQQSEGYVAGAERLGARDPQQHHGLEESRILEGPRVDGVEAYVFDELLRHALAGHVIPAEEVRRAHIALAGPGEVLGALSVERFEHVSSRQPLLKLLRGRGRVPVLRRHASFHRVRAIDRDLHASLLSL